MLCTCIPQLMESGLSPWLVGRHVDIKMATLAHRHVPRRSLSLISSGCRLIWALVLTGKGPVDLLLPQQLSLLLRLLSLLTDGDRLQLSQPQLDHTQHV